LESSDPYIFDTNEEAEKNYKHSDSILSPYFGKILENGLALAVRECGGGDILNCLLDDAYRIQFFDNLEKQNSNIS